MELCHGLAAAGTAGDATRADSGGGLPSISRGSLRPFLAMRRNTFIEHVFYPGRKRDVED
jgi:hypothetical protein